MARQANYSFRRIRHYVIAWAAELRSGEKEGQKSSARNVRESKDLIIAMQGVDASKKK
jgi:hypothetical protein